MAKYFNVHYIGGAPHGLCWIRTAGDGGAYDPAAAITALKAALSKKLADYSSPERQAHLRTHNLTELNLLVHGGFNAYAYNTPPGSLSLQAVAEQGAVFYAEQTQRQVFDRVWFFNSLDSADDFNRLFGVPPGHGRVRWLAQLWPDFRVYWPQVPVSPPDWSAPARATCSPPHRPTRGNARGTIPTPSFTAMI